jgi:hypothetical protein
MDDSSASIRISVHGISIEITGSEEFVSEQIEAYQDLFHEKLKTASATQSGPSLSEAEEPKTKRRDEDENRIDSYKNIYALDDGEVRLLLNEIPGSSYSEQTTNAALLYLFGKNLSGSEQDEFDTDEIRDLCKQYGCLDEANFMRHLKSDKRAFIVKGSGQSHTIKLTHPGRQDAKELIREIESDDEE